jgi:hypothetical protein
MIHATPVRRSTPGGWGPNERVRTRSRARRARLLRPSSHR